MLKAGGKKRKAAEISHKIHSFFKAVEAVEPIRTNEGPSLNINDREIESIQQQHPCEQQPHCKHPTSDVEINLDLLERDPGLRTQICDYPVNQRDQIRRAYIKMGPYQPKLRDSEYKGVKIGKYTRHFGSRHYNQWTWLEYSPTTHKAYCFPCFLFEKQPYHNPAFVNDGFNGWNRSEEAFKAHYGVTSDSPHQRAEDSVSNLLNAKCHVDKALDRKKPEEVERNRLRLKATIEGVRWLSLQACALRGHDESESSTNRGNLIEMIKFMRRLNVDIDKVVLEKAPKNAKYTSPTIQKEVLHIMSDMVKAKIREEIGDAKFSILVDEAKDASDKEQMSIVLRFVDVDGFIRERFFDIVHVKDTTARTLKSSICDALGRFNLHVRDIRGQGYDGASNMRGSWNGLQALFLRDSPYAYYVHCFAHRLQLALVAAAENEVSIWDFFSKLTSIVNLIRASPKRLGELQSAQKALVEKMIEVGELDMGRGANQIGNLQRAGKTRWSSHYDSICSIVDMYGSVITVLEKIVLEGATSSIRGEAAGNLKAMASFDFIFILHLMQKIMGVTYLLCQALQGDSLDILNAIDCVSTTKHLLQQLRENCFDDLLAYVKSFCEKHGVEIPNMEDCYKFGTRRVDSITVEHHYRIDVFNSAIDYQVEEINRRFNDDALELLKLSAALEPRNKFEKFDINHICSLAEQFYPADFNEMEFRQLRSQLQHYEEGITRNESFQDLSTLSELCRRLFQTHKSTLYHLVDRLIRLVLTLPVSTATTERSFSAMKLVKTVLRNKMENEYLADSMSIYVERELAQDIGCDLVINEFNKLKHRRVQLQ